MVEIRNKNIAVVVGSVRPKRIGDKVTKFVMDIIENQSNSAETTSPVKLSLSIVEIKSFNLPVFDEEPVPASVPARAQFQHEHSLAWSAAMSKFDGYILITPEYNSGPPGSVKNAFDYLYHELSNKPILIVSYGRVGGKFASESLARSFKTVAMHVLETRPQFAYSDEKKTEQGFPVDLIRAGMGILSEDSLNKWAGQKEEVVKGYQELRDYFTALPN